LSKNRSPLSQRPKSNLKKKVTFLFCEKVPQGRLIKLTNKNYMTRKTQKSGQPEEYTYLPLDDTQNYFYSHDIGLVAYLLCQNFELVGLDKAVRNKVLCILKRGDGIDTEVKKYWDFKSSVDAQSYFNQIKRLKNQIFSSE